MYYMCILFSKHSLHTWFQNDKTAFYVCSSEPPNSTNPRWKIFEKHIVSALDMYRLFLVIIP
jgi:hypothetical protein